MLNVKRNNLIGQSLLLLATIIWGTSFVVLKNAIDSTPPVYVISLRFLVSGLLLCLIVIKRIIKVNKKTIFRALVLATLLSFAYIAQTYGLVNTTPSRNAFLSGSYCILCPFVGWLILKDKPRSYNVISVCLSVIGIALISFTKNETQGNFFLGDTLSLASTIFNATHVVMIAYFAKYKDDGISLVALQMLFAGIVCAIFTVIFEIPTYDVKSFAIRPEQVFGLVYLTLACTMVAQFCLIIGQTLANSPSQSAVILSLEAVFGVIFSVLLGSEQLSFRLYLGFFVVFIAMLMSELKIDIFKPFRKKKEKFE